MSITKTAAKGFSWTASSTLIRAALQIAQLLIVARFLSAAELGILAIVNLVIGFAYIFGDAGLSNAIIYHKELNTKQLNHLYLINIMLGLTLTVSVILLALPISFFFDMPALSELLIALSPVFFIRSFIQQPIARLQQEFKFRTLAKAETISALIGFLCLLAFLEFELRMTAIVFSQLITATCLASIILKAPGCVRPSLEWPDWKQIHKPVKYGLYQSAEACVNFFSAQFDQLLIGKLMGAETLGIYSYIKSLVFRPAMQLINPVVHKVTFPLMSHYKEQHAIADIYWQILRVISLLNLPLYIAFVLYPEAILTLVFGESWIEHGSLLRWLAIYMLFISLINPIGAMLRATGEVKRGFWWNILVTITRPTMVLMGFPFGLIWIVKALVFQQFILFFLHWLILIKPVSHLAFVRFISAFKQAVILCLVSIIVVHLIKLIIPNIEELSQAVLLAAVYCVMLLPIARNIIKEIRKK